MAKKKGGRPTKYLKRYCDDVIVWGKQGMSLHEIALQMDISVETLSQWRKNKPEFSEAIKEAIKHAQGWWEKLGREGAAGMADINPTVYIFNMKNRFKEDWRDKQEIEQHNTHKVDMSDMTDEELERIAKG